MKLSDCEPNTEIDLSDIDPAKYNNANPLIVKFKDIKKLKKTVKLYDLLAFIFGEKLPDGKTRKIHIGCICEHGKENEYKIFGESSDGPSAKEIFDYKWRTAGKFDKEKIKAWEIYKQENNIDDNGKSVTEKSEIKATKTQEDIDREFLEGRDRILKESVGVFEENETEMRLAKLEKTCEVLRKENDKLTEKFIKSTEKFIEFSEITDQKISELTESKEKLEKEMKSLKKKVAELMEIKEKMDL